MKKLLALGLFLLGSAPALAGITVYTDRPLPRVEQVAKKFTDRTGIAVALVGLGYGDMLKRLDQEGDNTPADLLYVKDMVYLSDLAETGRLQAMSSSAVQNQVAPALRDPRGFWTALTMRARTIVYSSDPERVDPASITGYEDLAKPEWQDRLCLRTSNGGYNEALTASFVFHKGYEQAKALVQGLVRNMAMPVFPNDTSLMEAIVNGQCDVGIVNSYYLGQMLNVRPHLPVKIMFAHQNGRGVHVNGTGIGITRQSRNQAEATKFIEFLLEDESQLLISSAHFDYPAKRGLLPNTVIKEWGSFRHDSALWSEIAKRVSDAKRIFREVGYQ